MGKPFWKRKIVGTYLWPYFVALGVAIIIVILARTPPMHITTLTLQLRLQFCDGDHQPGAIIMYSDSIHLTPAP